LYILFLLAEPKYVSCLRLSKVMKNLLAWGTGDSWYSSLENLKFLRNEKVGFLFAIANHRRVSPQKGQFLRVQEQPFQGVVNHPKL